MNIKFLRISLFMFFIIGICANCFAFSIRINEPKINLTVPAGGAKTGIISVDNLTDEEVSVMAYAEDWQYAKSGDGTKEFFPRSSTKFSCSNWLTIYPAEFQLPAFGRKDVQFTVRVPEDASGGFYSVVFFESKLGTAQTEEGVFVAVAGRLGSLIYLQVEGKTERKAAIEAFKTSRTDTQGPVQISFIFKNTGNTDITAKGTYNIIDDKGMVFVRGQIPDIYTLQGDRVEIKTDFLSELEQGNYDFILTLDLGQDAVVIEERSIKVTDTGLIQTIE